MNWKLTPEEPTPEMVRHGEYGADECYREDPCGKGAEHIYKDMLSAAPDPIENTELVERVAKWLAVHYKDPPATAATGFYLNSKWPHFVGGAQDLLKCIEGKE